MQQQSPAKPEPKQQDDAAKTRVPGSEQASKSGGTDPELQNEGEGSRTATRRYDAGAERAAANPKRVEKLADEAKKALEGSEGEALRRAEERGKKGPRP